MHLDDEQLQRLLHGELDQDSAGALAVHVAGCADCQQRLSDAERDQAEVYGLLRLVDHPPPPVDAESVAADARGHDRGWGRWVAGILLAMAAAGVAYAASGSLPGWIQAVREWTRESTPSEERPRAPVAPMAGLAVPPGDGLTILFESPQPRSQVRISLGEGAEVRVRGPSGAATFDSEADRLRVFNRDSVATFEIEIPRDARRVEVRVAGRRIFLKDGARVVAEGPGDHREVYLLPLAPPPSQ